MTITWRNKRGRAFTLIELLAVVSVIGVLAAVAGANYLSALDRADRAACQQHLRALHAALGAYRLDYGRYPPADGTADTAPSPNRTEWGCGPAANGYWSGAPLALAELGYCPETVLYCPALRRRHSHSIEAWPTCADSAFAGRRVPQWRFLRFAYNAAATDAGGYGGGDHNIESDPGGDVWLARCLHLDTGQFDPEREIRFPFRIEPDENKRGLAWYGEYELAVGGAIRERAVQLAR